MDLRSLSDNQILRLKLKDLYYKFDLKFKHASLIQKLYQGLQRRGITFRPEVYPSSEWMCADSTGAFAYNVSLLHPRLIQLERQLLGFCEGESVNEAIKIMRHECGHAIDNAFKLRKSSFRRELFPVEKNITYPDFYHPQKYSTRFVKNLNGNYAQSHPDEDFAETFAVWLTPKKEWQKKYHHTPALRKLIVMDILMRDHVIGKNPQLTSQKAFYHIKNDDRTVYRFLMDKRKERGLLHSPLIKRSLTLKDKKQIERYSQILHIPKYRLEKVFSKQDIHSTITLKRAKNLIDQGYDREFM